MEDGQNKARTKRKNAAGDTRYESGIKSTHKIRSTMGRIRQSKSPMTGAVATEWRSTAAGPVSTKSKDTDNFVGALHLSNNTAEHTAAIQVMLYFVSLHEHSDKDLDSPPPPRQVLLIADSTYTINAATKHQLPYGRRTVRGRSRPRVRRGAVAEEPRPR